MTGTNQHSLEMGPQRVWAVHGPHASLLCLTVALLRTWHSALCKSGAAQTWTEDLAQTLYPTGSSCWRDLIRNRLGEPMSKDIVKKSGDLGGKKLRNLVSLWYRKKQSSLKFSSENGGKSRQEDPCWDHSLLEPKRLCTCTRLSLHRSSQNRLQSILQATHRLINTAETSPGIIPDKKNFTDQTLTVGYSDPEETPRKQGLKLKSHSSLEVLKIMCIPKAAPSQELWERGFPSSRFVNMGQNP